MLLPETELHHMAAAASSDGLLLIQAIVCAFAPDNARAAAKLLSYSQEELDWLGERIHKTRMQNPALDTQFAMVEDFLQTIKH